MTTDLQCAVTECQGIQSEMHAARANDDWPRLAELAEAQFRSLQHLAGYRTQAPETVAAVMREGLALVASLQTDALANHERERAETLKLGRSTQAIRAYGACA